MTILRKHCAHTSGYFLKAIANYEQHYTWENIAVHATDINWIRGGTVIYCSDCNRRLGPASDLARLMAKYSAAKAGFKEAA